MRRTGFTLIEILAVLAIILVLAAVLIPQMAGRARDATPTAVLSTLSTAAGAIGQFKADTRRYPGRLEWLATTVGTPTDICGSPIPVELLDRWGGPYIQRQIGGGGIPAGDATVINALERADPAATVSSLVLRAAGVTRDAAETIDREVDGIVDLGTGAVRWLDAAGAVDTLYYYLPIRGC